jgi:hypothetical protein
MIQVRKNVFETNSSSTHSLVMAVKSEFDKWQSGEYYYCNSWYSFSEKEAPEEFKNKFKEGSFFPVALVDAYYEAKGEDRDPYDFQTYDEFCDSDYLEYEDYTYTTPGGEVIVAVAKHGYDG